MGTRDTALFLVVAVASPRWIATAAAVGPGSLSIWLITLVAFFLPLGFTVLELSSRHPEEGGIYVWTRRAFGPFAGFMTAWMYWASNLAYFPGLLYFTAANALLVFGSSTARLASSPLYFVVASLAGLALALGLNLRGLDAGRRLHNLGGIATWLPVAGLLALAAVAWARFGSATDFTPASLSPAAGLRDLVFWSTIAFAFAGLEVASIMGGEIRDAGNAIPRALVLAGVLIVAVYVLGTLAVLVALPQREVSELAGIVQAIGRVGERAGLAWAGPVGALLITVSCLGGVGAWLASSARLPFVAGIDHILPAAFARLHPRWGTPVVALLVQGIGSAAFIVMGQGGTTVRGAYDALVSMTVITYFLPYLLMFASLIRLQREPAPAGTRRVPGGRAGAVLCGALGFVTTAAAIALALVPPAAEKHPALAVLKVAGSSLLLVAVGAFLYFRPRARSSPAA